MLKPLTLSLSVAVALGACSLGVAGGHGKSMPSAQCETPSAQCAVPSAQCNPCDNACAPKKSCFAGLGEKFSGLGCNIHDKLACLKPKPKCYSYEWVLKKKRCGGGLFGGLFGHKGGCGEPACDSCGGGAVYPTGQTLGSPQAWGSGQNWGSGQGGAVGSGQAHGAGQAEVIAPAGQGAAVVPSSEVPPAPPAGGDAPKAASNGSLLFLNPAGN